MRRIFPNFAYSPAPRDSCWWDETIAAPDWPELRESTNTDVAIIGAGFTGLSAAVHLSEIGCDVVVLETQTPGWGASGRNGGFCCLGGAKISDSALIRKFGIEATREYRQAEHAAVDLVAGLLDRLGIDADRHSDGETILAHRRRDMERLRREADALVREGGVEPVLLEASDLAEHGMNGPFHGAMTTPVGFALNPRKYVLGLANAAAARGTRLYRNSPALSVSRVGRKYRVESQHGNVTAETVIIATNGYSSEDVPDWLARRYLPSQSNVLVTRPLTPEEIRAQGWHSDQMAYDTRNLLHYFRLMPDRRFLFGMRGGLMSSRGAETRSRRRNRRDFERMFPAWRHVPSQNQWSGLVCLARQRVPFIGAVPVHPGLFAGLAYHGNGVAMGSYAGKLLADLVAAKTPDVPYSAVMASPPEPFPLGRFRRLLMPAAYLFYGLRDF
jgi:glycine/D-amino acid oxidase-like deaminating enzyme